MNNSIESTKVSIYNKTITKNKYDRQEPTTTTEQQGHDLGQAHIECCGVKLIGWRSNPVQCFNRTNYKNQLKRVKLARLIQSREKQIHQKKSEENSKRKVPYQMAISKAQTHQTIG